MRTVCAKLSLYVFFYYHLFFLTPIRDYTETQFTFFPYYAFMLAGIKLQISSYQYHPLCHCKTKNKTVCNRKETSVELPKMKLAFGVSDEVTECDKTS